VGLEVPAAYKDRVRRMAWFSEAYTRPDGSAPCWGDADDGRALAFGGQHINDHRYLLTWVGRGFEDAELAAKASGSPAECIWLMGHDATCSQRQENASDQKSKLFKNGGYAVLRNQRDHVFVDCGPIGMGGRGGHGHNDVLACEVFLDGSYLIADCGAYVYTADYDARNRFRSTAYHNTPCLDGEEINRFVRPDELWWFHDDAKAEIRNYQRSNQQDVLTVAHSGYMRLSEPIMVARTYTLNHTTHSLLIKDEFEGSGHHRIEIPLHLAPGVVAEAHDRSITLRTGLKQFVVQVHSLDWAFAIEPTELSPSYGLRKSGTKLVWRRTGRLTDFIVQLGAV
jgi:hypothetical protein